MDLIPVTHLGTQPPIVQVIEVDDPRPSDVGTSEHVHPRPAAPDEIP